MATAISSAFNIDYTNKRVYDNQTYTDIYTVNALYSYLQNTFDELEQMDDPIPMSAQTPTEYTLINGWFMDNDSFKYLKTGAVQTSGHLNAIQIVPFGATYTSCVATDIGKMVTDDAANTGNLLAYDNTAKKWWVRWGTTVASGSVMTITGGTGAGTTNAASATGENLWPNIYTLGSIEQHVNEEQIYIEQNGARIFSGSEWWPEDKVNSAVRHIDVSIKTKEAGTEISNGTITVYLRNYPSTGNTDLYDHFGIDLTAGGRNAVPLATSPDMNNTSYQSTVSGYNDIKIAFVNGTINYSLTGTQVFINLETVTQGTVAGVFLKQTTTTGTGVMTLGNVVGTFNNTDTITGGTSGKTAASTSTLTETYTMAKNFEQGANYNYSVIIGCATRVLSQVYEYFKYVNRIGSTYTMYPTTYPQGGPLSHSTKEGQLYIRAHEDTQTTPTNTFSPVKASPFGTFAGGKLFGSQGIWIESMATADIQNFQLIDSDGNTRTPPNKQAVAITNLLSDDRVSVFRTTTGTTINKAVYTAGTGNVTASTTFVVNGSIEVDTPSAGYIRVVDISDNTNTRETRYGYTSWVTSTFSGLDKIPGGGGLDRAYTQTDDTAYIPFIDTAASGTSVSVTVIYTSDRTLLLRVRRYTATAILPFETEGTFKSTGYSQGAIRTTDSIVSGS